MVVVCGAAIAAQPAVPAERLTYRDLAGRVVDDASGQPLAGVTVSLLYETTVTDDKGEFRFEKVPLTHTAQVSARVRNIMGYVTGCITIDVPTRYYPLAAATANKVGIAIVDPGADLPFELRIATVTADRINSYCQECHPSNPCAETESYRQAVESGRDLRGIVVDEGKIGEFTQEALRQGLQESAYRRIRYQDTHPDGMNMESVEKLNLPSYKNLYKSPKNLALADGKYVICDTCHTRHVPTPHRQYVILPFEDESNSLCLSCHK